MAARTPFVDYITKIAADWLNRVDATIVDALGATETPEDARAFLNAVEEAPTDGQQYTRGSLSWSVAAAGTGGGVTDHNFLTGRSDANQHPTAAVTGLDTALADASRLTAGTVGTARLGAGSAISTTFLRGDQTWAVPTLPPSSLPGLAEGLLWVGNAAGVAVATSEVASGTAIASDPILTLTQTWNGASVAFQGLVMSITATASLARSKLLDLRVGGDEQFAVLQGGATEVYNVGGINYEAGTCSWDITANVLTLGAVKAGTGTLRDVNLVGRNIGINTQGGALATTATSFFLVGSCAGVPTGVPASVPAGMIPVIVDTAAGDLYLYI